ncbi:hypothetical protein LTSEUGA_2491 [Salmonella enterica subsp. enterica serovar Uganda str. R8-3404]|uniref:Uncharacterized protein n=1 Tax=Salmonella enterica subsp. enterica serovar Uganda str. R8-3404 TaxID=913083 RepID=A0A6C8H3G4_SALET|nr:hypothetical protein LTSEHVI_2423 [Salmonella enterica subsp. enterica serovar Hvittingfoss str. A4-620]EHC91789.1 hypothetical protein LTSEUGA_2491 [Salmonella enterica subsp. enterica serovar Uganda str. R8-3404]
MCCASSQQSRDDKCQYFSFHFFILKNLTYLQKIELLQIR